MPENTYPVRLVEVSATALKSAATTWKQTCEFHRYLVVASAHSACMHNLSSEVDAAHTPDNRIIRARLNTL